MHIISHRHDLFTFLCRLSVALLYSCRCCCTCGELDNIRMHNNRQRNRQCIISIQYWCRLSVALLCSCRCCCTCVGGQIISVCTITDNIIDNSIEWIQHSFFDADPLSLSSTAAAAVAHLWGVRYVYMYYNCHHDRQFYRINAILVLWCRPLSLSSTAASAAAHVWGVRSAQEWRNRTAAVHARVDSLF